MPPSAEQSTLVQELARENHDRLKKIVRAAISKDWSIHGTIQALEAASQGVYQMPVSVTTSADQQQYSSEQNTAVFDSSDSEANNAEKNKGEDIYDSVAKSEVQQDSKVDSNTEK
ncbi:hypothetical protein MVEN_00049900 [Mycena venus]|uniref:Uncharacterized protein n=1 Tax=Mycena venus TaxID=2733690 RepID=A0A8H7DG60_9AGAR|nr:hypothetical protein MVEN_00049900 [Mycena venus]